MKSLHLSRKIALVVACTIFVSSPVQAHAASSIPGVQSLIQVRDMLKQELSALLGGTQASAASPITVNNDAELAKAIGAAIGGETIYLNPGTYSSITIYNTGKRVTVGTAVVPLARTVLSAPVTITSANPSNRAKVTSIKLNKADKWRFDSLSIRPTLGLQYAIHILASDAVITRNDISYADDTSAWTKADWNKNVSNTAAIMVDGPNAEISYNYLKNVGFGISVSAGGKGSKVIGNTIDTFSADAMRGLGDNLLFENNFVTNALQTDENHSDGFQSWSDKATGKAPNGVTIRNNTFLGLQGHPFSSKMQGIGLFDGPYENFTITNNLIVLDTYHGIAMLGGVNSVIKNNVVIDVNTAKPGPAWILASPTKQGKPSSNVVIEGNVTTALQASSTGVTLSKNKVITVSDYATYFPKYRTGAWSLKSGALPYTVGTLVQTKTNWATGTVITTPSTPVTTPKPPMTPSTKATTTAPVAVISGNVVTTRRLTVYTAFNGTKVGQQSEAAFGVARSTEVQKDSNGKSWVYVDFSAGVDGYVPTWYLSAATSAQASSANTPSITGTIVTTRSVSVLDSPSGIKVGQQKTGAQGTVTGTGRDTGGREWLNIDFQTAPDGYVPADYVSRPTTTPASSVAASVGNSGVDRITVLRTLIQNAEAYLAKFGFK